MKGLLQRRFSRVAVRGAAKVRLRALQAITGRIQGRFEVEEGKFYSAEDADRATSTNYLYQEPDCRVERLPDALASTLPGRGCGRLCCDTHTSHMCAHIYTTRDSTCETQRRDDREGGGAKPIQATSRLD